MFMFALLSMVLVLSRVRIAGDDPGWISSRPPASTAIAKSIHGRASEPAFYGALAQPMRRHLLEHPRGAKQAYRGGDYNAVRRARYQPRSKLDEGRFYRSAVEDDNEDEDENDEEEEEEEDKIDDENADEEAAEDEAGNEEETVAGNEVRSRVARSGSYVPSGEEAERGRQAVVRRSITEECEDEATESPQYYEYETEVRNSASQDGEEHRGALFATMLGANVLTLLLV